MLTPHQYYNAINRFYQGNYQALQKIWHQCQSWPTAWKALAPKTKINPEKEWDEMLREDIRLVLKDDQQYPSLLKEIALAPFGLYVKGSFVFSPPLVAVVGTRKATAEGLRLSQKFAKNLAEQNITIVSGLALGIDQAAHRGALEAGGKTIAVLAHGLDEIYPRQNQNLGEKIIANGGALVSEYPIKTPSYALHFLERNRIISGLSLGTLVIEAPFESGSLVTAKCAVEQNREVFVVPGPVTHPNYAGSHKLIKNGAALVTDTEDICLDLNLPILKQSVAKKQIHLTLEQKMVLNYIEAAGHSLPVDKIIQLTKLEPYVVNQTLASLVINDIIKEYNGRYSL